MSQAELVGAVREAAAAIRSWTGVPAAAYFEEIRDGVEGPAEFCHAVGVIEGAAIALGMTPIELLDDLGTG